MLGVGARRPGATRGADGAGRLRRALGRTPAGQRAGRWGALRAEPRRHHWRSPWRADAWLRWPRRWRRSGTWRRPRRWRRAAGAGLVAGAGRVRGNPDAQRGGVFGRGHRAGNARPWAPAGARARSCAGVHRSGGRRWRCRAGRVWEPGRAAGGCSSRATAPGTLALAPAGARARSRAFIGRVVCWAIGEPRTHNRDGCSAAATVRWTPGPGACWCRGADVCRCLPGA